MRLNGWQRIGALASVVWVLAGPVYLINKETHHATKQASLSMKACYKEGRKDCLKVYDASYAASSTIKATWGNWALFAFVPIVAAWLVVWGIVALLHCEPDLGRHSSERHIDPWR
jgi:hypothetical protein